MRFGSAASKVRDGRRRVVSLLGVVLGLGLSLAGAEVILAKTSGAPKSAQELAESPKPSPRAEKVPVETPDYQSDTPPPSTYDRMLQDKTAAFRAERTLTGQIVRMLVGLAIVIALIYLVLKIWLPKVYRLTTFSSGKCIEILEKVQLDPKHAVYLVRLAPMNTPVLLGVGGEQGVQLLKQFTAEEGLSLLSIMPAKGLSRDGESGGSKEGRFLAMLQKLSGRSQQREKKP